MIYLYIDGDNIGLRLEKTFMENDEVMLRQVNEDIQSIVRSISTYLQGLGFTVIFAGADGVICRGEKIDVKMLLSHIRQLSPNYSFSVGVGTNLKNAFLSLRYAKSVGKDVGVIYKNEGFEVVRR